MSPLEAAVKLVHASGSLTIRDPLWGNIHLPPGSSDVLEHPAFKKLRGIKQLGPAHLVYPGACHDRFSHSLGVYWLAFRMVESFSRLGKEPDFVSLRGLLSFLHAALVHDLGHFPYTHSLKELALEDHEALTATLVEESSLAGLLVRQGADPAMVATIVDTRRPTQDPELRFYRHLLSGVLDPDKLDYLRRDAWFCGVPYGVQDTDHLLGRLEISRDHRPCLPVESLSIIEHLLFSKYLMYKAVYWHRDVRIATAMIKKFLHANLGLGSLAQDELYGLDDAGFWALGRRLSGAGGLVDLPDLVSHGRLYRLGWELSPENLPEGLLTRLEDLAFRRDLEADLQKTLAGNGDTPGGMVILDLPENISFEVDFPLRHPDGRLGSFKDSPSVFTPQVVSQFTTSLRKLRVLLHPRIGASPQKLQEILNDVLGS